MDIIIRHHHQMKIQPQTSFTSRLVSFHLNILKSKPKVLKRITIQVQEYLKVIESCINNSESFDSLLNFFTFLYVTGDVNPVWKDKSNAKLSIATLFQRNLDLWCKKVPSIDDYISKILPTSIKNNKKTTKFDIDSVRFNKVESKSLL